MIDTILSDSFPKEVTKAKVKEIFEILHTQERPDLIKEIKNLLQLKTNGKDGLKTSKVSKIIIWKIQYFGVQARSWVKQPTAYQLSWALSLKKREISVLNLPHGIYFHTHVVWKLTVLSWRTKMGKKCPKFAAQDLFPRACSMEIDSFELAYENGKKVSQICRTGFISTRM